MQFVVRVPVKLDFFTFTVHVHVEFILKKTDACNTNFREDPPVIKADFTWTSP